MKKGYVYILTNKPRGILYIGVTTSLDKRLDQYYNSLQNSFVKKYKLKRLVHIEEYPLILEAISREKQLKNWHRQWKINLIEENNPDWNNLLDPETSSG